METVFGDGITKCLMGIGKTFFFFSFMKTSTFWICFTFFDMFCFDTWSQNYIRRYKESEVFNQIFEAILNQAIEYGFIDMVFPMFYSIFIDFF